ncbi:MAG: hypothetical protein HYT40_04040, partial [Candidatus Sungbacteria bacterium]|nr:hypothetical protein [Candidatus Sungbacteria bacterium]
MDFKRSRTSIDVSISEILRVLTSSRCPYREKEWFESKKQFLRKNKRLFSGLVEVLTLYVNLRYSGSISNMQHAILTKLHNHLNNGINREADVVYLFIEIGKYLEQNKNPQFSLIRFYRNWIAHSQINDTHLADEVSTALEEALASSEVGDYI